MNTFRSSAVNRYLFRNISIYALGNYLSAAVSFVMLPIITRYMTRNDYGIVTSITTITAMLSVITSLQLNNGLYRCYFDYYTEKDRAQFVGTVMISVLVLNVITVCLCFLFHGWLVSIFPEVPFSPYYIIGILTLPFSSLFYLFQIIHQINEKPVRFITLNSCSFVLNFSFLIYFVVVKNLGAFGMLLALLLSLVLSFMASLFFGRVSFTFRWSYSMFRNALSFGLQCMPYMVASYCIITIDRALVSRYASNEQLGLYGVAFKLASVVSLGGAAVIQSFEPFFFRIASTEELLRSQRVLGSIGTKIIISFIFVGVGMLVFNNNIVKIMLGKNFSGVAYLLPYLVIASVFSAWDGVGSIGAKYVKKQIWFTPIYILAGGVNILLDIILIPLYGARGAAMASIAFFFIIMVLRFFCSQKVWRLPLGYRNIFEAICFGCGIISIFYFISFVNLYFEIATKIAVVTTFLILIYYRLKPKPQPINSPIN